MPAIIGDGIGEGEVTYDAITDSVLDASQLSCSLLNDKLEFLNDLALCFCHLVFFFLVMQNASQCLVWVSTCIFIWEVSATNTMVHIGSL